MNSETECHSEANELKATDDLIQSVIKEIDALEIRPLKKIQRQIEKSVTIYAPRI